MPSSGQLPKRRDIAELIEALRAGGLPVTAGEAADAARITAHFAAAVPSLQQTYVALRGPLRCVLCKSVTDQAAFDSVYDLWSAEPPAPTSQDGLVAAARRHWAVLDRRHGKRFHLVIVALLLIGLSLHYWQMPSYSVRVRTPGTEATGGPAIATVPLDIPPTSESNEAAVRVLPLNRPDATADRRAFSPSLRVNEEIRPGWLLLPAMCLFSALALLAAAALPRLRLSRQRGSGNREAKPWPRSQYERILAGVLAPATQARLRRHLLRAHDEHDDDPRRALPDLRRTVDAAVSRLGLPRLHFRAARRRPSYLVLVCADGSDSFSMLWAARLAELDVRVDRFLVSGLDTVSPHCSEIDGSGRRFTFDQLPAPEPGQRLIVLAPLPHLFDVDSDAAESAPPRLRAWWQRARLERWRQRALFALEEPRCWQPAQVEAIERHATGDPGMVVLPLDDNAIGAWSEWLVSGRLPTIVLTDFQRYPAALQAHPERFVDDAEFERVAAKRKHAAALVADTITQLQAHLGRNGFYWLCACAVAPVLTRDLAVLLGERYFRNCGTPADAIAPYLAQSWRKLARLPWLDGRHQMPQWLRVLLLQRLPEPVQRELRAVIRDVLVPADTGTAGNLPVIVDDARETRATAGAQAQALYIGFIEEGLTAEQLLLRVSARWARLARKTVRAPRWHRRVAAGAARWTWRDGLVSRGIRQRVVALSTFALAAPLVASAWIASVDPDALRIELRWLLFRETVYAVAARPPRPIDAIAYGKDLIATAGGSSVLFWRAATATPSGTPLTVNGKVNAIALDATDTLIAMATDDSVTVRRLPSLALVSVIPAKSATSLAFDAEGQLVTTFRIVNRWAAVQSANARSWRVADGTELPPPRWITNCDAAVHAADGVLTAVRLSQSGELSSCSPLSDGRIVRDGVVTATYLDSKRIAAVIQDDTLQLLDDLSRDMQTRAPVATEPGTRLIAANATGDRFVTASSERFQIWSVPDARESTVYANSGISDVSISPDGRLIALVRGDGFSELLDARSTKTVATLIPASSGPLLAFSPQGDHVLGREADRNQLWRIERYGRIDPSVEKRYPPGWMSFSPDGRYLFAEKGIDLDVIDVASGSTLRTLSTGAWATITSSRDGSRLLVERANGQADIVNLQASTIGPKFGVPMSHTAISPDGSRVAGIDDEGDGILALYDTVSGRRLAAHERTLSNVTALDFSADGALLATASREGLRVSNGRTAAYLSCCETRRAPNVPADRALDRGDIDGRIDPEQSVTVRFAPVGYRLAAASSNGTVRIWDASAQRLVREFRGANLGEAPQLQWTADGKTLLVSVTSLVPTIGGIAYRLRIADDAPVAGPSHKVQATPSIVSPLSATLIAIGVVLLTVTIRTRRRLERSHPAFAGSRP